MIKWHKVDPCFYCPEIRPFNEFIKLSQKAIEQYTKREHKEPYWVKISDDVQYDFDNSCCYTFDENRHIAICITKETILEKTEITKLYLVDWESSLYVENPKHGYFDQSDVKIIFSQGLIDRLAYWVVTGINPEFNY